MHWKSRRQCNLEAIKVTLQLYHMIIIDYFYSAVKVKLHRAWWTHGRQRSSFMIIWCTHWPVLRSLFLSTITGHQPASYFLRICRKKTLPSSNLRLSWTLKSLLNNTSIYKFRSYLTGNTVLVRIKDNRLLMFKEIICLFW